MHVNEGDLVWLYVKKPVGAVVGYAVIDACVQSAPASVWKQFGSVSGILKSEFSSYFDGATSAFAMQLDAPKALDHPVELDDLRATLPYFHPPQFYCRLASDSALRDLLTERSRSRSVNG
jgi:predicted transcriptional regulator